LMTRLRIPAGVPREESIPDTSTLVSRTICGVSVLPPRPYLPDLGIYLPFRQGIEPLVT
jgi:hypothetical protein